MAATNRAAEPGSPDDADDDTGCGGVSARAKDKSRQIRNGTVEGNRIHGTMKVTDPEGKVTRFRFKGEAKTS